MRVLFAGSPAIAVPALLEIAKDHRIVGVLTNPPSAQGRGKEISPTPVAAMAAQLFGREIPVLTPERLGSEAREEVAGLSADILVAFAYGRIFGPKFLSLFPSGGINVHPSLLPRHRGSSPIQQAILDRDAETGVSIQKIALEMDSGELLAVERFGLGGRETSASLSETCAAIGARLAAGVLRAIESGTAVSIPQKGEPTYCRKIAKDDGLIHWQAPAPEIDALVRAFNPWPGAFTFLNGQRLNILAASPIPGELENPGAAEALPKAEPGTIISLDKAKGILVRTGNGILALETLQFSGKKALSHRDFANGARNLVGSRLISAAKG